MLRGAMILTHELVVALPICRAAAIRSAGAGAAGCRRRGRPPTGPCARKDGPRLRLRMSPLTSSAARPRVDASTQQPSRKESKDIESIVGGGSANPDQPTAPRPTSYCMFLLD
jgi:hypothetical protein